MYLNIVQTHQGEKEFATVYICNCSYSWNLPRKMQKLSIMLSIILGAGNKSCNSQFQITHLSSKHEIFQRIPKHTLKSDLSASVLQICISIIESNNEQLFILLSQLQYLKPPPILTYMYWMLL